MKILNINAFLINIFVITLLTIVLDWLWAIVIVITIILFNYNSKTDTEYCINKKIENLTLENLRYSDLQSKSSVSCVQSELHMKMSSNTNLVQRDKLVNGSEKASLSSLIHRGTTRKMGSLRNNNQPLLSVLKNNTYLRKANSYHQSPLKSPLYQSMSPAKLNCIYNSPLTPNNSFTSPIINNQFTSPSVQMHYLDNFANSRSSENVNGGLEVHGAYFLNKSLLHTESSENMYSLVNKNFSSPASKRCMGNELYHKRKKETEKFFSPTTDQPSRSKRKKFDNSDLDSTLNELFPPMMSSGSPLRKRISNIRSSANRLVSTASQYENLQEFKLAEPVKALSNAVVSRTRFGLTEEQTDELMDYSAQVTPVENKYNNDEVKNPNSKLDKITHTEKKVKFNDASTEFNDTLPKKMFNESNSNSYTSIKKSESFGLLEKSEFFGLLEKSESFGSLEKSRSSALKELKSPYRKIFSSLSSQTLLGSSEKLRDHPVYFNTHIDIDEIQNSREEFGSKGVSISAFRNNQEHAVKLVNDLLDGSDYSKQKTIAPASLKEQIATSFENKASIISTSSLPVSATTLFVDSSEKPSENAFAKPSPTFLKSDSLKSTNQPLTFGVQETSLAKVNTSENNFKPPDATFSFVSPSSLILPSSNAVSGMQVTNSISNGSLSSISLPLINPNSLNFSTPLVVSSSSSQIGFSFATTTTGFSFPKTNSSNDLNTSVITTSLTGISFVATTSISTLTPSISFSLSTLTAPASNVFVNQFTSSTTTTSLADSGLQTSLLSLSKNTPITSVNFNLSSSTISSSSSISTPFTNNLFSVFGEKSSGTFLFGNSAVCTSVPASTQSSTFFSNTAASTTMLTGVSQSVSLSNTFDKTNTFSFVPGSVPPSVFNFNSTSSQTSQISNLFGTTPSTLFSSTTTSLFAAPTSQSTHQPPTLLFGAPAAQSTSSVFNPPTFPNFFGSATTVSSASALFNPPAQVSNSVFNFKSSSTTSTTSGFSFPSVVSSGFGTSNIFGNTTTVSASIFGAPPISSSALFGAPPTSSSTLFGAPPTSSALFGASISNSGSSVFGQTVTQSSVANVFGNSTQLLSSSNPFGQPLQQTPSFNFGVSSTQSSSMFGVQSAPIKPAFNFGSQPATPSFNFNVNDAQTPSFASLGTFGNAGQPGINFNSPVPGGGFSIGAGTPSSGRQTSKARRRLKK
ncbi:uncharacterized protein LOC100203272 isoform X1 [Hydra vulgaris]|uniref:Uncharacterized protein LOC100203272 isoform X1 n=1 Tax=Hydra vulgaris TaxID=6087 RepID=A0ABM4C3E8_HYDVU